MSHPDSDAWRRLGFYPPGRVMNDPGPRNEEIVTWHPPKFTMVKGDETKICTGDNATAEMEYYLRRGWNVLSHVPGHNTRKWKYTRIPGDG